ncbi:nucleotidyltransferase domain-containing protein [Candidatus Woesearchaeota archaeon]|nr:nucleotidyltransferase domain-containing protein [Candidatus Woesearchaeota archaeon]
MFNKNDISNVTKKLLKIDTKKKIKFIFLFGSYARNKANLLSDLDIAIYYDGNNKERFHFRLKALNQLIDSVDVQMFQDLPLLLQHEVLEGTILFVRDEPLLYNEALRIIKEFNYFERVFDISIGAQT